MSNQAQARGETLESLETKIQETNALLRELEKKYGELKEEARLEAIATTRNLMRAHGLTLQDLGGSGLPKKSPNAGKPAPVKYRDAATGNTWSGRGLQPNWLKAQLASGKSLEDFRV